MAATLTAPAQDDLIAVVAEAVEYRKRQLDGCCWVTEPCSGHRAAADMARALRLAEFAVSACRTGTRALAIIRGLPQSARDEITGATTDQELIAAITGGTDRGGDQ